LIIENKMEDVKKEITFDLSSPLDLEKGLSFLGDEDTFFMLLETEFENSMLTSLEGLKAAIDSNDVPQIKFHAHSLKGPASYIGAGHVFNHCKNVQDMIMANKSEGAVIEGLIEECGQIVKACLILKPHIRKVLAGRHGQTYVYNPEDEVLPISSIFEVVKQGGEIVDVRIKKVVEEPAPPRQHEIIMDGNDRSSNVRCNIAACSCTIF